MILAGWPFVRASSALGSRHHSSGKELGQSPYVQKWKRTCPAWTSYAITLLSAFGWRRRPALRDKNPFSSKWPKDGLRSPSTPRRRKQDRHFVKIAEVAASISWTRRGEAFRRKSPPDVAKPRVEPQHIRAVQQRSRITDDAKRADGPCGRAQAGPNRSRPARCAWQMTDCHAAALNRSRQPGPTTSRGARGAAGNWLAGYESGAYDLISLAERRTRRAE